MKYALLAFFFTVSYAAPPSARECQVCQLIVTNIRTWYAKNGPTDDGVFLSELLNECKTLSSSSDTTLCTTFSNCQNVKIHGDMSVDITPERTCIDIGSCDGPLSSTSLRIIDWTGETSNYNARCVPVTFLILHHTVTHSAWETLQVLDNRGLSVQYIHEKNGTVYQMVHDYWRAWHAGTSRWGTHSDLNSWSVGVEIVNTGDEAFPVAQMDGLVDLSRMLIDRWHIAPHNIVGHFDIQPENKNDPSGWFDWKYLYTKLGLFDGIYDSDLTDAEKHTVLLSPSSYTTEEITKVQEGLSFWGYKQSITINGKYDDQTSYVIQAFNRHWCPEVFIKEKVDYKTNDTVINKLNWQWYLISQERLEFLLNYVQ